MLKVAFGNTVYVRSSIRGDLDGIAVYTKFLLSNILDKIKCKTFCFETGSISDLSDIVVGRYKENLVRSFLFNSVERRIKEEGCQILHCPDHVIPYTKLSIPLVSTIHDVIPLQHPEWIGGRCASIKISMFKYLLCRSTRIITVSNYSKLQIHQTTGFPLDRIDVVYPGLTVSQCNQDKISMDFLGRFGLEKGQYFIVIGTLQPRKNINRIIKAFMNFKKDAPRNFKLVIVGREGWGVDSLIKYLKSSQAANDSILWLNYLDEVVKNSLLKYSRAFIFPSLNEGFGLPLLESFYFDVPVITSNITSMPEIAGCAALKVDPYSVEQISSAMNKIFHDEGVAIQLITAGRHQLKNFSWRRASIETISSYYRAIDTK